MKDFLEIKTKRLLLSQLKLRDVPEIVKQANNKKIADMTINIPYPYLKKDALHWVHASNQNFIKNTAITFKISLKKTNEFIGGIGLTMGTTLSQAELGFWIAEDFWNQGYATEASSAVLHFSFKVLGIN